MTSLSKKHLKSTRCRHSSLTSTCSIQDIPSRSLALLSQPNPRHPHLLCAYRYLRSNPADISLCQWPAWVFANAEANNVNFVSFIMTIPVLPQRNPGLLQKIPAFIQASPTANNLIYGDMFISYHGQARAKQVSGNLEATIEYAPASLTTLSTRRRKEANHPVSSSLTKINYSHSNLGYVLPMQDQISSYS